MEDSHSYGAILKNKGFLNLWTNQILVQFAYNSLNFAMLLWVYFLTRSNLAVAGLLICVYLPAVIFGMFSGVLVDITNRKKIIIATDLILTVLVLSFLFFKSYLTLVLGVTFIINAFVQFYISAESSSLPLIVKSQQLLTANSLFTTTYFAMFLVGFGLSGPIIGNLGINAVFIIGAVSLFLAFILSFKFPSIAVRPDATGRLMKDAIVNKRASEAFDVALSEIKTTVRLIRGKMPVLFSLLILSGMQTVVGAMAVLMPSFLEKDLQISATDSSYIMILPLGLGMIIGALIIGKLGYKIPKRVLVGRSVLLAGVMLLSIGLAPLVFPAIKYFPTPKAVPFFHQPPLSGVVALSSLLLGLIVVSVIIPSQTVLQENTSKGNRGKVFGVLVAVMSALSLPFVLFTGVLSDIFGTIPIFLGIGGIIGLTGLLIIKPDFFFEERHLPLKVREFLGVGHWDKK